jgi:mRNA interferase RelE/StbE
VTEDQDSYVLAITPTARRQLTEHLPEAVAVAAYAFITGPLLDNPHRVGKQLRPPLDDGHSARRGTYRVIYRIDEESRTVTVVDVAHQRDAYRTCVRRVGSIRRATARRGHRAGRMAVVGHRRRGGHHQRHAH